MNRTNASFCFDDSVVLVTGSSSGIGERTARDFAFDGAKVALCSRTHSDVEEVEEAIEKDGGNAVSYGCDVRNREDVRGMIEDVADEWGTVDVLVNNAGVGFVCGFQDLSENAWDSVVDINLKGCFNCTQAAGKYLQEGRGSVVNISSVAGVYNSPYMSHYGASKAAMVNLTESLAVEWAETGVRVNCVAPGYVATEALEKQMGVEADEIERESADRRVGTPDEVSDIVRFLASDGASFVNGETLVARGKPTTPARPGEQ
ncbi:MAG: SDR family NAD(P)-dependent oxidoreductase [Halobacteria archaeon]